MGARRRFLKSLAAAPLLPAAWSSSASTPGPQVPAPAPSPEPSPAAQTPAAPAPSPSPSPLAPSPAAESLGEVVRHRYGAHLAPADLEEVNKGIESNLRAAERLRTGVALTNADEPVTSFAAGLPAGGRAAPPRPAATPSPSPSPSPRPRRTDR